MTSATISLIVDHKGKETTCALPADKPLADIKQRLRQLGADITADAFDVCHNGKPMRDTDTLRGIRVLAGDKLQIKMRPN